MTVHVAPDQARAGDNNRVVPSADGLRGLAAFIIVVFHCWVFAGSPDDDGVVSSLLGAGFVAIDFFFVISGFVLFLPTVFDGEFGSWRRYARRRLARIAPAYWVALLGVMVLWPWFGHVPWIEVTDPLPFPLATLDGAAAFGLHVVFLHTLVLGPVGRAVLDNPYPTGFLYNGALWTLTIEVCFYVALPFIAAIYRRRPFVGLGVAMALQLAWRWSFQQMLAGLDERSVAHAFASQFRESLPAWIGEFAVGMTAAWVYGHLRYRRPVAPDAQLRVVRTAFLVAFALLMYLSWRMGHETVVSEGRLPPGRYLLYVSRPLIAACFGAALLSAALDPSVLGRPWASRAARWFGTRSYGVYLWHVPVGFVLMRFFVPVTISGVRLSFLLFFAVGSIATLAGALSWRFIERPAIRRAHG